ncbi:hypothetical protein OGAPHI_006268 [Ogataea philodendri]|uniref:Uncharacterized protein n=1 Tax=Ogataea philodendri TaxID=1378263 RepID=A0A9P8NYU9_9ASCO|nr:uncharacterized protein OGAPHI_006268 [Ogataea philodendri]KAH3662087.1 hypothetical protein OGAPHI_006268 [Ogataea philodendri]
MNTRITKKVFVDSYTTNMDGTQTLHRLPDYQDVEDSQELFWYKKTLAPKQNLPSVYNHGDAVSYPVSFQFPVDSQLLPSSCDFHGQDGVGHGSVSTEYFIKVVVTLANSDPVVAFFPISFQCDSDHVTPILTSSKQSMWFEQSMKRKVMCAGSLVANPLAASAKHAFKLGRYFSGPKKSQSVAQLASDIMLTVSLNTVGYLNLDSNIQQLGDLLIATPQTHEYAVDGVSTGLGEFAITNVRLSIVSQMTLKIGHDRVCNPGTPVELLKLGFRPGTEPRFDVAEFSERNGMLYHEIPLSAVLPARSLIDSLPRPFVPNISIGKYFCNRTQICVSVTLKNTNASKKGINMFRFAHDIVIGSSEKLAPNYDSIEHAPAPPYTCVQPMVAPPVYTENV